MCAVLVVRLTGMVKLDVTAFGMALHFNFLKLTSAFLLNVFIETVSVNYDYDCELFHLL